MGNEAVQALKLLLILFRTFGSLLCSDSNFKPGIYRQFTALEIVRSFSKQMFVEESEILYNPMKSFQTAN